MTKIIILIALHVLINFNAHHKIYKCALHDVVCVDYAILGTHFLIFNLNFPIIIAYIK